MAPPAERVESAVAVLDASVVVDLLIGGSVTLPAELAFVAPAHLDAEVLSALARLCRAATLSSQAVHDMLAGLAELAVERMPLPPLLAVAFELRENVAQRDSLYVALARVLECTLLTRDDRLAAACRRGGLCAVRPWNGTWV
jgi:predicted nucleic acid-binding protein